MALSRFSHGLICLTGHTHFQCSSETVGVWWSKYEAFSAEGIEELVLSEFARRELPLDVLQMDVDCHIVWEREGGGHSWFCHCPLF